MPFPQDDPRCLNVIEFDRLLRESQREVLRLQRQIALKNFKECLRPSKIASGGALPGASARRGPPGAKRNPRIKGSPLPKEARLGEPAPGGEARREVRQAGQQSEVLLLNYSITVVRKLLKSTRGLFAAPAANTGCAGVPTDRLQSRVSRGEGAAGAAGSGAAPGARSCPSAPARGCRAVLFGLGNQATALFALVCRERSLAVSAAIRTLAPARGRAMGTQGRGGGGREACRSVTPIPGQGQPRPPQASPTSPAAMAPASGPGPAVSARPGRGRPSAAAVVQPGKSGPPQGAASPLAARAAVR